MKYLIFISIIIFFLSCEKQEDKIRILFAKVDGDSIAFTGYAYQYNDISNKQSVGYSYHIFNLESPKLYITAFDSTFESQNIIFSNLTSQYVYNDSLGVSKNYFAIDGNFKLTKEQDGVLFGEFDFVLLNELNNLDTLKIEQGYFEISLEKHNRYLDN